MKRRKRWVLAFAWAALGAWGASPARAQNWPDGGSSHCASCGRTLNAYSVPAPPPESWPRLFRFAYRGRQCPPAAPCQTGQAYAAPAPAMVPGGAAPYGPMGTGPLPESAIPGTEAAQPGQPGAAQPGQPGAAQPGQPGAEQPGQPGAAQPGQPGAATAGNAAAPAGEGAGANASGLGGGLASQSSPVVMFGDLAPVGFKPPPPPEPPPTRGPFSNANKSAALTPSVRSFKIADNQTPFPVDRVSYSFNYFDNLSQAVNQRQNVPIDNIQGYRHVFGFEKAFWDGNASFGMRLPLNTLSGVSAIPGVGRTSTSLGDLSMYFKYAFWMDREAGRVFSGGLAVTAPTGPSSFAGAPYLRGLHYTQLQPYLASQWTWDRLYMISFASVNVPTSSRDATVLYGDVGLGYYVYRSQDPNAFIRAIAPTFEVHVNAPTNHRDVYNPRDLAGSAFVTDLTQGVSVFLGKKTVLSVGVVEPVTSPRPFSIEALALLNVFF